MSCYKLPESVCHEIESLLANFWWGSKNGEKKVHWLSWNKMAKAKGEGGLGFRGISDFNKSLLGKHYWRLLTDENSLFAKVFKGRYYPRSSIMESTIGFRPSYAWRSILSARELISKGARWRIGNGEKVMVCKDSWMPENPGFKILGEMRGIDRETKVNDLIDSDTGAWKRDLIFASFDPSQAKQIISIPLSFRNMEDKIIWHFERDGEFSVRSAYHLSLQNRVANKPGPSSVPDQKLWKEIWRAPVHSRTQNFLWRLAKNIIPSKDNLSKRGISLENSCSFCQSAPESTHHLFMDCEFAKTVFFSSVISYRIPPNLDFNMWLKDCLTCGDLFSTQLICSMLQKIWNARNSIVFQQMQPEALKVAEAAFESVTEFNNQNPEFSSRCRSLLQTVTSSVPNNVHILQVDAGIGSADSASYGCIIKNPAMETVMAACKKENISVTAEVAEILAIRWCLSLAIDQNLERVIIQSDSLLAVECINSITTNAVLEPVAADCRFLLEKFHLSSVMYLSRTSNSDAHNLVEFGKVYGSKTWFEGFPNEEPWHCIPVSVSS